MMFYGFIFMSRKMSVDQPRMAYRLGKLKMRHTAPDGKEYLNPMWLLLFPEGTNLSDNGRVRSAKWAEKSGIRDCEHMLLPRSTGMYFVLKEIKGTVDYVYDCTVAYEGIPSVDPYPIPPQRVAIALEETPRTWSTNNLTAAAVMARSSSLCPGLTLRADLPSP